MCVCRSRTEAGTTSRGTPNGMSRLGEAIKMHRSSPIAHVDKVKAPTLLVIGLKDKRVPPLQSIEYYRDLKERGVPTK